MFMLFLSLLLAVFLMIVIPTPNSNWATASRQSANLVPPAHLDKEAQVQIYSARAFAWRGRFSVHTWIATKEKNASSYLVYHAALWNTYRGQGVIGIAQDLPDRYWYGAKPEIIYSASGELAEKIIPKISAAVQAYPCHSFYRVFPGPNSNTFVSHVIREVKEIKIALPSNAVGKDYLCRDFFAQSEGKTGYQFSFYGLLGIILDWYQGVEVNILGLSFGIDFIHPAISLPLVGRLGTKKPR